VARYLLDTTVLIDYFHGNRSVTELISMLNEEGHFLGVCGINIAEFYSGLSSLERQQADEFIRALEFYSITLAEAKRAGQYRYDFARRGVNLNMADTVIAAVAVEENATLVTGNLRHFPMPEIRLMQMPSRRGYP